MSITERIRYGGAELKAAYNRNLGFALVISIAIHGGIIALYLATASNGVAGPKPLSDTTRTTTVVREYVLPRVLPPLEDPRAIADPIEPNVGGGTAAGPSTSASSPTGLKPLVVSEQTDLLDRRYPTTDDLPHADASGSGADSGVGTFGNGSGSDGERSGGSDAASPSAVLGEPIDLDAVFESDVELPTVSPAELSGHLAYPEIAQKHQLDGTVQVKALIGIDGMPERVEIVMSDNRIFDEAAREAVRATRFTPGRQNGAAVRVWVVVPIRFELR